MDIKVQLPQQYQLQQISWMQSVFLDDNVLHLCQGSPFSGNSTSYAGMSVAEISASWYTPVALAYFTEPENDTQTLNALDILAHEEVFNYSNGDLSDPPVTVTGFYITSSSSVLVGYGQFPTPITIQHPYDGFSIEPFIPVGPFAV